MTDATLTFTPPARGALAGLRRGIASAASWAASAMTVVGQIPSANRAAEAYRQLIGMTDDELRARGLTRDGLATHCFGELLGQGARA